MARISTGDAYGEVNRKASGRLLGGGEIDLPSMGTALEIADINQPALRPQASPVESFIDIGRGSTIGGPVVVARPPEILPPNGDMERLARALGDFSPTLRELGDTYVLRQRQLDKQREQEGSDFAAQAMRTVGAYTGLADLQRKLEKRAGEGDPIAQQQLQYLQSRHPGMLAYLAESVQETALLQGMTSLARKVREGGRIPDGRGGEVELASLPPDSPLIAQWMSSQLVSDQVVSPRILAKHQQQMVAVMGSARDIQQKAHVDWRVGDYKRTLSVKIPALAAAYSGGTMDVGRVAGALQDELDNVGFLGLPLEERQAVAKNVVDNWTAALLNLGVTDPSKALEPLTLLDVGPQQDRVLADGSRNLKLSLVEVMGGESWLRELYTGFQAARINDYNQQEAAGAMAGEQLGRQLSSQMLTPEVLADPLQLEAVGEAGRQAIMQQLPPGPERAAALAAFDADLTAGTSAYQARPQSDAERRFTLQVEAARENPALRGQVRDELNQAVRSGLVSPGFATSKFDSLRSMEAEEDRDLWGYAKEMRDAKLQMWEAVSGAPTSPGGEVSDPFEIQTGARAKKEMDDAIDRVITSGRKAGKNDMQIMSELDSLFKNRNFGIPSPETQRSKTVKYGSLKDLQQRNKAGGWTQAIDPARARQLKTDAMRQPLFSKQELKREIEAMEAGKPVSPEFRELLRAVSTGERRIPIKDFLRRQMQLHGIEVTPDSEQQLEQMSKEQKVSFAPPRPAMGNPYLATLRSLSINAAGRLAGALVPPAAAATIPTTAMTGVKGFDGLLGMIRSAEGGWESVNRRTAGDTPGGMPGISRKSIGEVEAMQNSGRLFAVGAYQFTPGVLARARKDAGLPPSAPFSPENQNKMAMALVLKGKRPRLAAYITGRSNDINAAHEDIALEWAGLAGPSGRGMYDGDSAGNRASQGASRVRAALQAARRAYLANPGS